VLHADAFVRPSIYVLQIIFTLQPMPASVLITCGNVVGRLWLHFSAVYIITGITCYLLYHVSNSTLFFAFLWLPTFSIFARHFCMHPFPYKDTYLLLCVTSFSTVHQSSLTSVQLMSTCWVWHLILQLWFHENSYFY